MKWMRSEECRCGVVVSDEPVGIESYDRPDHVAAYGGYLIAESIPPQFVSLIAAAPELLMLVNSFVINRKQLNDEHFSGVADRLFERAAEVVAKAKGEST